MCGDGTPIDSIDWRYEIVRIACLLDSMFEDSEHQQPADAFRQAGHEVVVISPDPSRELTGYRGQVKVRPQLSLEAAQPEDFDALFIPGGFSPDHLRLHRAAVDFARTFMVTGKPVLALCHGPQLLITADVVRGRTLTAWPTVQGDLQKVGANAVDREVVVDRSLVTSRQPADIPAFVRESLALMEQYQRSPAGTPATRGSGSAP
jgi:protease I